MSEVGAEKRVRAMLSIIDHSNAVLLLRYHPLLVIHVSFGTVFTFDLGFQLPTWDLAKVKNRKSYLILLTFDSYIHTKQFDIVN